MKVCLFGSSGKVGSVLGSALEQAGHEIVDARSEGPEGCDVAVDFTRPDAVPGNAERCLASGVPLVIGTSGFDVEALDRRARAAGVPCIYAPNFALGAVLMMRFAEEAARALPRAEIVELHADTKLDAPSGTAKATAARIGGDVPHPGACQARARERVQVGEPLAGDGREARNHGPDHPRPSRRGRGQTHPRYGNQQQPRGL